MNIDRISVAKKYLSRKYSLAELKDLADTVATSAFEAVTITGAGFEAGSSSGQITFEKMEYLAALEELIESLDTDLTPPTRSMVVHTDRSGYDSTT